MDIKQAADDLRAKQLQESIDKCVAELRPILEKYNFTLSAELNYSSQGISARPVLMPKPDGITIDTKEKVTA